MIKSENETVSHHYTHHVLLMAVIPVVCAFIGTTQIDWNFGGGNMLQLLAVYWFYDGCFVLLHDAGGYRGDGRVIWDDAKLSAAAISCALYGFYRLCRDTAFLSGLVALYSQVMAMHSGRRRGSLLHRLFAVSEYSDLPQYQLWRQH